MIKAKAQDGENIIDDIMSKSIDLDDGMVLIYRNQIYHGSDCIHMLALLSSSSGLFNKLNALLFRSQNFSRLAYPVLRSGRNLLLKILGKSKIHDSL